VASVVLIIDINALQLKNWHLEGTAKLIFKPLTGTIPGFGAVLVSLTEPVSITLHSMAFPVWRSFCRCFQFRIMLGSSILYPFTSSELASDIIY
jgi:hypothetical protein